jgi:hypothetical protein
MQVVGRAPRIFPTRLPDMRNASHTARQGRLIVSDLLVRDGKTTVAGAVDGGGDRALEDRKYVQS